jgi:hypothetical protein
MAFSEEQHIGQMLADQTEGREAGRQMFWDPETQSIQTRGSDSEKTGELPYTGEDFKFSSEMKGCDLDRHHG